jgi:hypothetical protein
MNHGQVTRAQGIHSIVAFVYANAAARAGATGLTAADVGKVALQADSGTYWILASTSPTWLQVNVGAVVLPSWKTLFSVDFTAHAAVDMSVDGAVLVGGVSATKQGSSYGSSFVLNGIQPNMGLSLMPNMAGANDPRQPIIKRPSLRFQLNTLLGSSWPHGMPLRVTTVLNYVGAYIPNGNNQYLGVIAQGTSVGRMGSIIQQTGGHANVVTSVTTYSAPDGNYSLNASTDSNYTGLRVLQLELPQGVVGPIVYRGAAGTAIPSTDDAAWLHLGVVASWGGTASSTFSTDPTAGLAANWAVELGNWGSGYENAALIPPKYTSLLVEAFS